VHPRYARELGADLSEILSFLPWGYAPLEVVYKVRGGEVYRKDGSVDLLRSSQHDDGKVGWACWSIRSQDTIVTWEFDEDGAAVAFTSGRRRTTCPCACRWRSAYTFAR
jgi:hypothetical protein